MTSMQSAWVWPASVAMVIGVFLLGAPSQTSAREAAAGPPAMGPQDEPAQGQAQEQADADPRVEELARVLGMTASEVEDLALSPEEMQALLAGFTEETVVVGFPRATADGHGIAGAGRRPLDRRAHQPGRGKPAGPAPDRHPVVQRQHAADRRRVDGRPPGDAPQSGPRPHAGAGQRQAAPPLVDHRLARRQRGRVRVAGPRHLGHPGHRAAAGWRCFATGRRPSTARTPSQA